MYNGATLMKQRLLQAAGWRVVNVAFYEWDALNDCDAQREYLHGKLCDIGLK